MQLKNRKGQGMLEYIVVVGAVMVLVIAFATSRMTPSTRDVLTAATTQVDTAAGNIANIVP